MSEYSEDEAGMATTAFFFLEVKKPNFNARHFLNYKGVSSLQSKKRDCLLDSPANRPFSDLARVVVPPPLRRAAILGARKSRNSYYPSYHIWEYAAAALRQIQDLELKQKRMAKLMKQRRQERAQMELEVARLERMKKHMQVSHSW